MSAEQLKAENAKLKREIDDMMEERDALKERIRMTIGDLLKEKKALKDQSTDLKTKLEEVVRERNELLDQDLEKKVKDTKNLRAEIMGLEAKSQNAEEELAKAKKQIETLTSKVKNLEESNAKLRKATPRTSLSSPGTRDSSGSAGEALEEEGLVWNDRNGSLEIKAGRKEKLVEKLHSKNENLASVPEYVQTFLLTYRKFSNSKEIMAIMEDTYNECALDPTNLDLKKGRLRICNFLKGWVSKYFFDFDEELIDAYNAFVDNVYKKNIDESLAGMLSRTMSKKISGDDIQRTITFDTLPPVPKVPKDPNFTFEDIDPLECARQLTLIEFNLYKAVVPKEFLNLGWQKSDKEKRSPQLLKLIRRFNEVSGWVTTTIVSEPNAKKRTRHMVKFIKIAEACRKLNNFNAVFEISAGLNSSAVHRLKKTWESSKYQKQFDILRVLTSNKQSFKEYRAELHGADPPCLPYLGVYLSDLTFVEEGNPDFLDKEEQMVNFFKCRLIADIIREIQQYQQKPYNLVAVSGITKFLTSQEVLDEAEAYKRSLIAEPRG